MILVKIEEKNWEQELKDMFEFDADISGENGADYTDEQALELGYETTLEFFIGEAKKKFEDYKDIVEDVLNSFVLYPSNVHYYDVLECKTMRFEDFIVVGLIAETTE